MKKRTERIEEAPPPPPRRRRDPLMKIEPWQTRRRKYLLGKGAKEQAAAEGLL